MSRPAPTELDRPDGGPFVLASAPRRTASTAPGGSLGMILMPAAAGVGAVVMAVSAQGRPLMAVLAVVVLLASIAVGLVMVIGMRTGERRRTRQLRERYLDHVELVRRRAREAAAGQRRRAARDHPHPRRAAALAALPGHRPHRTSVPRDVLTLRVGMGTVPLHRPVLLGDDGADPLADGDPVCVWAAAEVAPRYTVLTEQPVTVRLSPQEAVTISGHADRVRSAARALLAQIVAARHGADLAVLICSGDHAAWEWAKWLPHCVSRSTFDGPLPGRLIVGHAALAAEMLALETDQNSITCGRGRRTVVILDRLGFQNGLDIAGVQAAARAAHACVIHLVDPGVVALPGSRIEIGVRAGGPAAAAVVSEQVVGHSDAHRADIRCLVDELSLVEARAMARSCAGLHVAGATAAGVEPILTHTRNPPVDVATLDVALSWRQRPAQDELCAPIGTAEDGVVTLDLKEAAHGGVGPHGLVVGATGSGKSELLRTLLTGLAIGHPPERLALLVADFKGGATFAPFAALPHLAGMVTNLDADAAMVDRFRAALSGEVHARQEIFAAAAVTSLDDYTAARQQRPDLPPIPRLLVVVDEFSELLGARPDLAELFATIGRVGRSIGVSLLLATQRLDTGRIRGLESHLSYRICLRTFSEAESKEAIGSGDAFRLPTEPGWAYFVTGGQPARLFRAATVSRRHRPPATPATPSAHPVALPFDAYNGMGRRFAELVRAGGRQRSGAETHFVTDDSGAGLLERSVLDVAVERVCLGARDLVAGRPVRQVWLPPLPDQLNLSRLLHGSWSHESLAHDSWLSHGSWSQGSWSRDGATPRWSTPFGLIDIPERQRQELLHWNPADGNGNLLIVGAGRSGKSTALATLLVSLAHHHPPSAVHIIGIDTGGNGLRRFAELPHVAAIASRSDPDLVRRIFDQLMTQIGDRETAQRDGVADTDLSLATDAAAQRSTVSHRVVLLIDGWTGVVDLDPAFEQRLEAILTRGPGVGVHVVMTAGTPTQLRARVLAGFAARLELRLADPFDSVIDRRLAAGLGVDRPGRALVAGSHLAQLALPTLPSPPDLSELVEPADIVAAVRSHWAGQQVARITALPSRVTVSELQTADSRSMRAGVVLGLADGDRRPVRHDLLGEEAHLVVYGDSGSGKSTVLRTVLSQVLRGDPTRFKVMVIDYRRSLSIPEMHPGSEVQVAADPDTAAELCIRLCQELARRRDDARRSAPRNGDSRTRVDRYVLVDDLDLVSTPMGNPLVPLLPFLPLGRDIGFHLVLARRAGGISRAQYEPLLQTLGDLATPALLLSASPGEGRLAHGLVPRQLPPGRGQWATRNGLRLLQTAVL